MIPMIIFGVNNAFMQSNVSDFWLKFRVVSERKSNTATIIRRRRRNDLFWYVVLLVAPLFWCCFSTPISLVFVFFSFLAGQHFRNYGNNKIRKYFGKFAIYTQKRIRQHHLTSVHIFLLYLYTLRCVYAMLKHFIKVKFKCGNWKSTSQGQPEKSVHL